MEKEPKPKKPKKSKYPVLENIGKYSGMAFQMIAIILVFVWAGLKLDDKFHPQGPLFIIILSLLGVFISLYIVLRDFIKLK